MTFSLLLSLLLAVPAGAQGQAPSPPEDQTALINPSDCGLVTHYASHVIPDGCYQKARNVVFDSDIGIQRRLGYSRFNATALTGALPIRRLYQFDAPDGTHYVMAVSSSSIWHATNQGAFTQIFGELSASENTSCTQVLGKFWCVNKVNGLFYWDGIETGTAPVATGPLGGIASNFRNRVLVADVGSNQSRLYASGYLDGTDWFTGGASTSAFIQPITGVNDGEKITCLMGTYGDAFIIGTPTRLFGLYGFDNNDFQLRELSREVGCLENTSVQEFDGSLVWLSRRGVERLRGTSIDWRVSDPIFDILQTIVGAAGNSVNATDTTQGDFQAGSVLASGNGAPLSLTNSPGNVALSSFTRLEDTQAEFNNWSPLAGSGWNAALTPGRLTFSPIGLATATIYSPGFDVGFSTPIVSCSYTHQGYAGDYTVSSTMSVEGSTVSASGPFDYSFVCSTKATTNDSTAYTGLAGTSTGVFRGPYLRIKLEGHSNYNGSAFLDADDFNLVITSTGQFISQCRNPGSAITSWGLFQCDTSVSAGESVSFEVSTGPACHQVTRTTATWAAQTNNAVVSLTTSTFIAYRATFAIASATQALTQLALQACTLNWNEGGSRPETASAVIDHRYYLFYTTSTVSGASNTDALVLDYKDRWSLWDNIPARSAVVAQSNHALITGDGASTGKAFRLNSGYDDAGSSFISGFRTRDMDLGDWKREKEFIGVKVEISPLRDPADVVSLTITSHVDKAVESILNTVSLGEDTGIVYGSVPTPLDSQVSGRYIGFEVSNTGTQHWRFYRGALQYRFLRED